MISIHALVKRATLIECDGGKIWIISIHALVKRATSCVYRPIGEDYFNPRPREEGDK